MRSVGRSNKHFLGTSLIHPKMNSPNPTVEDHQAIHVALVSHFQISGCKLWQKNAFRDPTRNMFMSTSKMRFQQKKHHSQKECPKFGLPAEKMCGETFTLPSSQWHTNKINVPDLGNAKESGDCWPALILLEPIVWCSNLLMCLNTILCLLAIYWKYLFLCKKYHCSCQQASVENSFYTFG